MMVVSAASTTPPLVARTSFEPLLTSAQDRVADLEPAATSATAHQQRGVEGEALSGPATAAQAAAAHMRLWTAVFDFLGPGAYLILASVRREWGPQYAARHPKTTAFTEVTKSVPLLEWARSSGLPMHQFRLAPLAARRGDVALMSWAHANGRFHCPQACAFAAEGGHLDALKWAHAHGCEWDERACSAAAKGGHLHVLEYLRQHGCAWDASTCCNAARGGHLTLLQWARERGCKWNALTCRYAAAGGHLAVLQWAHAHGCPWDATTCAAAAAHGRLGIVCWARDNGCPWGFDTCSRAAEGGHVEVLKWAYEHDCPYDPKGMTYFAGSGAVRDFIASTR